VPDAHRAGSLRVRTNLKLVAEPAHEQALQPGLDRVPALGLLRRQIPTGGVHFVDQLDEPSSRDIPAAGEDRRDLLLGVALVPPAGPPLPHPSARYRPRTCRTKKKKKGAPSPDAATTSYRM
jgi:hypothetical protein